MPKPTLRNRLLFLTIVIVPMIVAIIYYSLFAVNRYVSLTEVAVRQTDSSNTPAANAPGLALLLGATNPTNREETLYLRQFILSNDMLSILEKELEWTKHYSAIYKDPLFWLSNKASREDKLQYYRRMVSAHFDSETGLLQVEVQAFNAQFAKSVLNVILRESDHFVNGLSHRLVQDQLAFVERELITARSNYESKRDELLKFQAENNLLDAEATITARSTMIAEMESTLATERARMSALQSSLNSSSPQVLQQRRKIDALERQRELEIRRLITQGGSTNGDTKLNTVAAKFRDLTIQAGTAEEAYKVSLASLANTKIEINKKFRSLAVVISPNEPDEAIYPDRLYILVTVLIALLAILGVVRFVVATIEDHKD